MSDTPKCPICRPPLLELQCFAGERRALQARAVAALSSRQNLESRLLRAELMARIGPAAAAFAEAMAAAQAALAESAPRAARRAS